MKLDLKIREIRRERGMTLAELAGRINVSVPHLSEVERGVKKINNHLLERLSDALKVTPDRLISADARSPDHLSAMIDKLEAENLVRVEAFVQGLLASQRPRK